MTLRDNRSRYCMREYINSGRCLISPTSSSSIYPLAALRVIERELEKGVIMHISDYLTDSNDHDICHHEVIVLGNKKKFFAAAHCLLKSFIFKY